MVLATLLHGTAKDGQIVGGTVPFADTFVPFGTEHVDPVDLVCEKKREEERRREKKRRTREEQEKGEQVAKC